MRRLAHVLLALGTVTLVLAIGVVHANFRGLKYSFGTQNSLTAYLFLAAVFVIVSQVIGVLDEPRSTAHAIGLALTSSIVTMAVVSLVQVFRPGMLPRFVVTAAPLALSPFAFLCWTVARAGQRRQLRRDRVIAVVTDEEAAMLHTEAASTFPIHEQVFTLIDAIDVSTAAGRAGVEPLIETARSAEATVLVLTEEAQRHVSIVQQAARLHHDGCRVRTVDDFCDQWLGKLPLSSLGRMALLTDIGEVHGGPYVHIKRIEDVLAGLAIGAVCALIIPFVVIGNLIANRGPLFYTQRRIGLHGKPFTMLKFRTMRPSALEPDAPWTRPDDPRVTPFGRLMRRSHLDELPQFWNMLRGDLSLVGPRPEQPKYVQDLRLKLPFYDLRHSVQPGLTGWAQIKYRYAASEADAFEKLQYDLYYLRHQSVSLDARVLARTLRSLSRGRGR